MGWRGRIRDFHVFGRPNKEMESPGASPELTPAELSETSPSDTMLSEAPSEKLTPQEESTAGYYATTATGRSLEDIEEDLNVQFKKDPELVRRVLKRIGELRADKAKRTAVEEAEEKKE